MRKISSFILANQNESLMEKVILDDVEGNINDMPRNKEPILDGFTIYFFHVY